MQLAQRARADQLDHEVAIADGVERVGRHPIEAELGRRDFAVQWIARACQGARTERQPVEPGESILEPAAKVVSGYERGESGMPSYAGVLNDRQIESLILFIKGLK